ncbi:DUF2911 domain-containing protein [Ferruginibacter sp. SUN002]|uniref:DUF2911 domain-containing protein n=1 Tax=Ferruginibacter sp. SUN002 TaxID=2937789 RepID=UPI003D35B2E5
MRKLLLICMLSLGILQTDAQVKMPAPSPTQTVKQDFGIGNIELTYSRPSVKGRKIFGDLVPYNKIWRTGANSPTKIKLSEPAEIGGKLIDTGSYALYTIPGKESWEIIINKGLGNWGVDGYKTSDDVARFTVSPSKLKKAVETFTIQFTNIKPESCDLELSWQKTSVAIPITVNFKEKVKAQLEAALLSDKKPYWQAAQFYREYEKDLPKALENVEKATEENPKAFWVMLYKARILKEMGNTTAALEASNASLALAKEAKNDDYVKLNEDFQKDLK